MSTSPTGGPRNTMWTEDQLATKLTEIEGKLKHEGKWTTKIANLFEDIKNYFFNLGADDNRKQYRETVTGKEWKNLQQHLIDFSNELELSEKEIDKLVDSKNPATTKIEIRSEKHDIQPFIAQLRLVLNRLKTSNMTSREQEEFKPEKKEVKATLKKLINADAFRDYIKSDEFIERLDEVKKRVGEAPSADFGRAIQYFKDNKSSDHPVDLAEAKKRLKIIAKEFDSYKKGDEMSQAIGPPVKANEFIQMIKSVL